MMRNEVQGLRVLLIEDEELVTELIVDLLESEGCIIIGPFDRFSDAIHAASVGNFDVVLLDLDLAGTSTAPIAALLRQRELPFVFMTGLGKGGLPLEHAKRPVVAKPFKAQELIDTLKHAAARQFSS